MCSAAGRCSLRRGYYAVGHGLASEIDALTRLPGEEGQRWASAVAELVTLLKVEPPHRDGATLRAVRWLEWYFPRQIALVPRDKQFWFVEGLRAALLEGKLASA